MRINALKLWFVDIRFPWWRAQTHTISALSVPRKETINSTVFSYVNIGKQFLIGNDIIFHKIVSSILLDSL